jgi:hypothetical protein
VGDGAAGTDGPTGATVGIWLREFCLLCAIAERGSSGELEGPRLGPSTFSVFTFKSTGGPASVGGNMGCVGMAASPILAVTGGGDDSFVVSLTGLVTGSAASTSGALEIADGAGIGDCP